MLRDGGGGRNEKPVTASAESRRVMPVEFSKVQFARQVGQRFRIQTETLPATEVELVGVTRVDAPEPRPFALHFHGPLAPVLPQKIYRLEHDDLEAFELFLVPIGPDRDGKHLVYEAIFN